MGRAAGCVHCQRAALKSSTARRGPVVTHQVVSQLSELTVCRTSGGGALGVELGNPPGVRVLVGVRLAVRVLVGVRLMERVAEGVRVDVAVMELDGVMDAEDPSVAVGVGVALAWGQ